MSVSAAAERPVVYVRWQDATETEADSLDTATGVCIREEWGVLVHDQPNRLVICTAAVGYVDGSHEFTLLTIDPEDVLEKREVGR